MKTVFHTGLAVLMLASTFGVSAAAARDRIQIVGSSTVFPFSAAVAERLGKSTGFSAPTVESTGSGGGMALFCEAAGENTPDITNSSRRIKDSEIDTCIANGVTPVEVLIGYDGIVLANASGAPAFNLTRKQIFQALARDVVVDGSVVRNPYSNWSDIDPSLPNQKIEILGPPPTSGTRDAFVELVMDEACQDGIEDCGAIREDGAYIDAGENDSLIVGKLVANPVAVGIFGFSFLDRNADALQGATVEGVVPTFENIASGAYPVSRPLYFYVKKEHVGVIPGIMEYISEFTSDAAWGDGGYLVDKGLIPLPEDRRADSRMNAENLVPVERAE